MAVEQFQRVVALMVAADERTPVGQLGALRQSTFLVKASEPLERMAVAVVHLHFEALANTQVTLVSSGYQGLAALPQHHRCTIVVGIYRGDEVPRTVTEIFVLCG